MTPDAVRQALSLWAMQGADATLAARRENEVWKVTGPGAAFALRFHRPGYRSAAELASELHWMDHLSRHGMRVPKPVPMTAGGFVGRIEGHPVSLLTWLPGRPAGAQADLHGIPDRAGFCVRLGRDMARLHDLSDAMDLPEGFTRPDWRRAGLLGEAPLWGRFWDHPHLDTDQRALLTRARRIADADLAEIADFADQGLIHADLLTENILVDGTTLAFIDFDDGAIGFRDFELATFLFKFAQAPDFADLRAALCEGYADRRRVVPAHLDLMLLCRALTYPGWVIARLGEPGMDARSARAVAMAVHMAETCLKGR
jgi:Ser/Thr protein kinase RdoA (MazF antagonist)